MSQSLRSSQSVNGQDLTLLPTSSLDETCLGLMHAALEDEQGLQLWLHHGRERAKFLSDVRKRCYELRAEARTRNDDTYNSLSFRIVFGEDKIWLEISHGG